MRQAKLRSRLQKKILVHRIAFYCNTVLESVILNASVI